ncbi:hypothetical protein DV738_g4617, partial [Chaetothyriales sp. CBS 135597]
MALAAAVAVPLAAATVAAAAYLDAKFLIRNDLRLGRASANVAAFFAYLQQKQQEDKMLVYHIFEDRARTPEGDNLFLEFEGRRWTYREFFEQIHPVANWLLNDLGIQPGEIVAVDGGNSPEFLKIWFALEAIRGAPAFVNCNLTGNPLVHSVRLGKARYLLADREQRSLVEPVEAELAEGGAKVVYWDQAFVDGLTDTTPLPKERRSNIDPNETCGLIYTSGTTGLPKGTIISRGRLIVMTKSIGEYLGLKPGNKMYTCLPLYHAAAQTLCFLGSIGSGSAVVLSRKFSHKKFWPEVRASNADIIQYVGELCRYLINAPPSPLDKQHNVRMVWGNGMRPDVWEAFRERFGIEIIHELYAATDGVATTFNLNRGPFTRNAIAVRGPLWRFWNGQGEKRVQIDPDSQEIVRGENGFAIECKAGEAGESVYKLDPTNPYVMFKGYFGNEAATKKRLIANLFAPGDLWFRSGDLLRYDSDGRLFFVDRLGDTYRWHSENVSTNEVSDQLGHFPQIAEANVYGVLVPHADGRAGCVAIVPAEGITWDKFDFKGLAEHALAVLPKYAVPLFIRLATQLDYTGTMKMQKGRLRAEGIDLDKIAEGARERNEEPERLYWLPPGTQEYVPYEQKDWEAIKEGRIKL